MPLEVLSQESLAVIRAQKAQLEAKDAQLQSLGFSLAEEKIKNVQKDSMIQSLGQQLAQLKIDVAILKGAAGQ